MIADYVVATEPIPDLLAEIGWTSQVGIADGREWLYYLRPTDDGRIVIGGGAGARRLRRSRQRPRGDERAALRRGAGARVCCGCSRSSRAFGSRTRGAARSTRRRRSCRSTGRWRPATCTRGSATAATDWCRPTSGGHILASTVLERRGRVDDAAGQPAGDREGAAGAAALSARARGGLRARARRRAAGRGAITGHGLRRWWVTRRSATASG